MWDGKCEVLADRECTHVRIQKRLDRLPGLLRALDDAGVAHRFEVLGDGALRPSLERRLGGL